MEGNEPGPNIPGLENNIKTLLNELEAYKRSVNELNNKLSLVTDENLQLRAELAGVYAGSGATDGLSSPPARRKQARISNQDVPSGSSGEATSQYQNDNGFVPVTSRKNNNKKKIMQTLDADIKNVRSAIKNANCKGFTLKQASVSKPIKITVEAHDEIPIIRNALINNKISFHEFKWATEKQQAFVIRGLVDVTNEDLPDIFQELVAAGIPVEGKLSLFITGHMRANPEAGRNTLLKLIVPPEFDTQLLNKIKYIDHVAVSFEKLKAKHIVQCKNCQRFGHSAGGCQHSHRCVKCGENHLRDSCPRTYNKSIKLVCCNCGGDHTANNLSICPFFTRNFKQPAVASPSNSKATPALAGASKRSSTTGSIVPAARSKNDQFVSFAAAARAGAGVRGNGAARGTAAVAVGVNFEEMAKKIDLIMQLVSRHESLLQNLCGNG